MNLFADTIAAPGRGRNFAWLGGAWLVAILWFGFCSLVRCRCYAVVWHTAQAHAGLLFCGLVFIRVVAALFLAKKLSGWRSYVVLCVASPVWIPLIFNLVLKIRDSFSA